MFPDNDKKMKQLLASLVKLLKTVGISRFGCVTIHRQKLNQVILSSMALMFCNPVRSADIEAVPASEADATRQIVEMIEESVRIAAKNGSALRDAHTKSHGCVKAEFNVPGNLPEKLRAGIFSESRVYPAWIRYSNAFGKLQNDSDLDGRGMAIKLMGVERSESGTQDFLMINHPVFFVRNAADYVEFETSITNASPLQFFFPGFNPLNFRLHELGIANSIRNTKLTNPLHSQYWSTTPYQFGDKAAMKFSVRPCDNIPTSDEQTSSADFLRENMQKQLSQGQACFDFLVQLRTHAAEMPIEDPSIDWSEKKSPFTKVARITISAQQFTTPQQLNFCENLSFTPWHSIPDHRPLGGINRVRKVVYETVSRVRHEINARQRHEPAISDSIFKQ